MNATSRHAWWVLSWHMLPCSVSMTLPKICWPWGSRRPPDISTTPGGAPGTLAPAYLEPCGAGRRCLEPRSPPGGGRRAAAAARGASRAASSCWVQIPIELGARGRQRKARSRRQPGEAGLQRWFQRLGPGEGRAGGRASARRRLQQLEEGPAAASGDSEASRHFSWPLFGLAAELSVLLRALPSCRSWGSLVPTSIPLLRRGPTVGHQAWFGKKHFLLWLSGFSAHPSQDPKG